MVKEVGSQVMGESESYGKDVGLYPGTPTRQRDFKLKSDLIRFIYS